MNTRVVQLCSETDWEGFRSQSRALLAADTAPDTLIWHTPDSASGDLFAALHGQETVNRMDTVCAAQPQQPMPLMMPRALLAACESAALNRDAARWALMYRLLWRLQHEPGLRDDPIDPDRMRIAGMAQAVDRDMHKMKAFVRFRLIEREGQPTLHVAWFEPEHHIVAALAPFFVRRFTQMHWAILTPMGCASWDGQALRIGPPAKAESAPAADAGESMWLTYYGNIFNPARLKLDMMRKEMPRKYWRNLPEAALIGALTAEAATRSGRMLEAAATTPARRIAPMAAVRPSHDTTSCRPGDAAQAMAQWRHAAQHCRDCPIGEHATQAVWGEGNPHANLMLVGEQPGDQEDLRGRPFVGPAGQLLDRALGDLGWQREHLYLTNAVKHFKYELRGKRRIHKTAGQREAALCAQWLEREIGVVRPQALVALGASAARALLGATVAVNQVRGRWLQGHAGIPVLVTLHPSALLRLDPAEQATAYQSWLQDLGLASALAGATQPGA
jgi:probable DNA metabolism protein